MKLSSSKSWKEWVNAGFFAPLLNTISAGFGSQRQTPNASVWNNTTKWTKKKKRNQSIQKKGSTSELTCMECVCVCVLERANIHTHRNINEKDKKWHQPKILRLNSLLSVCSCVGACELSTILCCCCHFSFLSLSFSVALVIVFWFSIAFFVCLGYIFLFRALCFKHIFIRWIGSSSHWCNDHEIRFNQSTTTHIEPKVWHKQTTTNCRRAEEKRTTTTTIAHNNIR